jgi:ankyrin repeat protein
MASGNGHDEIVSYLIEAGADLNLQNETGNTALHWAALNNHMKIAI